MTLQHIKALGRTRPRHFGQYYGRNLIYKITNRQNGKIYIGLTTNLSKRLKSHLYHGVFGTGQIALHRAFRKYGFEQMEFEVVEIVDGDNVGEREQHWIAHYRSNQRDFGYNLNDGGYQATPCERTIDRMRKAAKNKTPVYVYDRDGLFVASYESINACARTLNVRHCSIWASINKGQLVKKAFQIRNEKTSHIAPHDSAAKGGAIRTKMKGNRNGTRYLWKVEDRETGRTHEADSLLRVAELGEYDIGLLSSLAYKRTRSGGYHNRLTIRRILKSSQ